MPGLVPGIHDFASRKITKVVDARHSPGMTRRVEPSRSSRRGLRHGK
jgi:hypothetical protein